MTTLTGNTIHLRALETDDLDLLYTVENTISFWEISSTITPYSKNILSQYLENAHLDIYEAKQLRLVIAENTSEKAIGLIDLFDFCPQHKRAGVGILILENEQEKGYASDALKLLIDYSFKYLDLHQLFANISTDNKKSIQLFEKHNFIQVGIKKDWNYVEGKFKDEALYQLLKI